MPSASEICEVFVFLQHGSMEARLEAVSYAASIAQSHPQCFDERTLRHILLLVADNPLVANKALACLINLTPRPALVQAMARVDFIHALVVQLLRTKNINADMVCMLLNNLSRHESIANILLPQDDLLVKTHSIDNMLQVFNSKEYSLNTNANFDFLAGVFANLSSSPKGCKFFLGKSTFDSSLRLSKLVCFTEHPNVMRRGGVISTLKNIAFGINVDGGNGLELMLHNDLNMLVYLLLPLSGPEDYDDDVLFYNYRKWKACLTNSHY
jgi:hypothetical protein